LELVLDDVFVEMWRIKHFLYVFEDENSKINDDDDDDEDQAQQ